MAKKVLVIDDEPETLSLLQYALEQAGFEVHGCDNGRAAWDEILRLAPDVVVMDVMLPGVDGYALQLKLSQEEATESVPIVVLTALEPSKTIFQQFSQVAGFVSKPFKVDHLVQVVSTAAQSRAAQ